MSQKETAAAKFQTQCYEALSSYLEAHHKHIVEIEILPSAIKPKDGFLMEDGRNLGVPKKVLAVAFVEARKIFFQNASTEEGQALALKATSVMLLFDPEHLTAANFRKRRLTALKSDSTPAAQLSYRKALKYEFCFLDTILTSPLHRQSKSPTLWNHRLWLLDLFRPKVVENVPEDVQAKFWRTELESVCKSGEQHPKNYYAWQYARRLVERIDGTDTILEFTQRVKDWCCKHPSDTSGWSCLNYLIPMVELETKRITLVQEVIGYALKLRLEHESLWVFIRTVLSHEALQQERGNLCSALRAYNKEIKDMGGSTMIQSRVKDTLDYIQRYAMQTAS
ncbi:protein prenylyltransferase [Phaeosphaeriaceae sp. SRC1lsM3a]|nr:protein prenylyltransferase [Stagonospora sp. SRC1lsM3a]